MQEPALCLIVVLYRAPLRAVRPLVQQLAGASLPLPLLLSVTINRDCDDAPRLRRCARLPQGFALEVSTNSNRTGVAGAYRHAMSRRQESDLVLLLDADSSPTNDYLSFVASLHRQLRASIAFACPDLRDADMRVSPYRLAGVVPRVWPAYRALPGVLQLGRPWGVVNAGLAGTAGAFATVDGFDLRIGLDMSDVAWSIAAGKKGATCIVHPPPQAHALSMRSGGFSTERAKRYAVAIWRLAFAHRDPLGLLRLSARGLRAWLRRRRTGDGS